MAGVPERAEVVIVGGGPAGTALAALLVASGIDAVVLERSRPEASEVGTGILLQPNGLAVLYGLGLRAPLLDVAVVHRAVPIYDERGVRIATGEMPDCGRGLDHALALLRPSMQRLLSSTLTDRGGAIRYGWEVRAVDPASGAVEVDGEVRCITGDVIVGADGIGSQVRRSGDFGARPITGGHRVIRAVVDGTFNVSGAEYWTALGLFGASPVGDGKTYAYASANAPAIRQAVESGDVRALVDHWSAALPIAAPLLSEVRSMDQVIANEVGRVRCRRFVDRRAVLIGDAAHAMAPNLGQGANSAFVDAAVLARALTAATRAKDALASYERQRRRPVVAVQRRSDLLASVSHVQHTALRRARDRTFRLAGRPRLIARQIRATQQIDPAALLDDVERLAAGR